LLRETPAGWTAGFRAAGVSGSARARAPQSRLRLHAARPRRTPGSVAGARGQRMIQPKVWGLDSSLIVFAAAAAVVLVCGVAVMAEKTAFT